jgi:hypothetical protein
MDLTPEMKDGMLKAVDNLIDQLTKLRAAMEKEPDVFDLYYSIDRGLEWDQDLGMVVRKKPRTYTVTIKEHVLPQLPSRS